MPEQEGTSWEDAPKASLHSHPLGNLAAPEDRHDRRPWERAGHLGRYPLRAAVGLRKIVGYHDVGSSTLGAAFWPGTGATTLCALSLAADRADSPPKQPVLPPIPPKTFSPIPISRP